MTKEEILLQLNTEQAEAASSIAGPVLVLAGAGTGKTRVITYRIAYMLASGIPPQMILGMTFTNKAAREMRERLAQLVPPDVAKLVFLGTFHSFCLNVLRCNCDKLGYLPGFTIADDSDQQGILKQVAGVAGFNESYSHISLKDAKAIIDQWKNQLVDPDEAMELAESNAVRDVAVLYREYQSQLALQNTIDFNDMLFLVNRLFGKFPDVLAHYRAIYHYILIDEYQDTNAAQFSLVRMLTEEQNNICVVGDDDQSIYSWRGADISNILNFPDYFPGSKVVRLEQNYRSTSLILDVANAVIGNNVNRHVKQLWSALGKGEPVKVVRTPSGVEEADFVGKMILQLKAENPELSYRDFAVLYRSNYLSREFEEALRRQQVPYRLICGQEFFKRREVKDAIAFLKLLVNPCDDQSLLRILNVPPRGLAQKAVDLLKRGRISRHLPMFNVLSDEEFQKQIPRKAAESAWVFSETCTRYRKEFAEPGGLANKIRNFLEEIGYLGGLQRIYKDIEDAMKRRENVDEFINAVAQYESRQDKLPTLENYLENLALLEEADKMHEDGDGTDVVNLMTIHAAKGLEFPVVFVVAMENGVFPHERSFSGTEKSIDEELRLFYVAITRACKYLFLTNAKMRLLRGHFEHAISSPFLAMLDAKAIVKASPNDLIHSPSPDKLHEAFENIFKILRD